MQKNFQCRGLPTFQFCTAAGTADQVTSEKKRKKNQTPLQVFVQQTSILQFLSNTFSKKFLPIGTRPLEHEKKTPDFAVTTLHHISLLRHSFEPLLQILLKVIDY